LNVASGHVLTAMTARHCAVEFIKFLNIIDGSVPEGLDEHLIVDNVSTHKMTRSSGGSNATPASRSTSLRRTRAG